MIWKAIALGFALAQLSNVAAQQPQHNQTRYAVAYRTEIKMTSGKSTGVLEQVTDSNVVVRNDLNGYDYIPIETINMIRIKFSPKMTTYQVQNFYDTYDDLDKTSEGFIDLNSPRNQPYLNRGIAEEVVDNAFFNAAGLLGTRAMNKLRKRTAGTVTKFRIAGDRERFKTLKPDLDPYALQFQLSPEYDKYLRDALVQ